MGRASNQTRPHLQWILSCPLPDASVCDSLEHVVGVDFDEATRSMVVQGCSHGHRPSQRRIQSQQRRAPTRGTEPFMKHGSRRSASVAALYISYGETTVFYLSPRIDTVVERAGHVLRERGEPRGVEQQPAVAEPLPSGHARLPCAVCGAQCWSSALAKRTNRSRSRVTRGWTWRSFVTRKSRRSQSYSSSK